MTSFLIAFVAVEHVFFMILETVLWQKPLGRKIFRLSAEKAAVTADLAKNQGVYNGFLAAALIASLIIKNPDVAYAFRIYGLTCVIIAGVVGAITVNRRIFFVQALPALIALALLKF